VVEVRSVDEWLSAHCLERAELDELLGILKGDEAAAHLRGAVQGLLAELKARLKEPRR